MNYPTSEKTRLVRKGILVTGSQFEMSLKSKYNLQNTTNDTLSQDISNFVWTPQIQINLNEFSGEVFEDTEDDKDFKYHTDVEYL